MAVANVYISDRYNNGIASDDLTSGEATAGDVESYKIDFTNQTSKIVSQLKVWLDTAVLLSDSTIAISTTDGAPWVQPVAEGSALSIADVAVDSTSSVWVQRTITAGAMSAPELLTYIKYSFSV